MAFILLIFLAAFSLEGIGTLTSVIGITKFFGLDWIVISLAIVFDIAKLSSVSFLYKEWDSPTLPGKLRAYMTVASLVLILITSAGAGAYLSSKFQTSMLSTEAITMKASLLEEEQKKLEARKLQIDQQIAQLPPDQVKGRARLIANFKTETTRLNDRLVQIDQELPKIKNEQIEANAHAGPITYLASALNMSANTTMSFIIGLIIFVFDPLAVSLILAGNYLVEKRASKFVEPAKQDIIPEPEPIISRLEEDVEVNNSDEEPVIYEPTFLELEEREEKIELEEEIVEEEPEIKEPLFRSVLNNPVLDKSDILPSGENNSPILKYYQH